MKTKKSWIMTLVLVLLVSLLAACGKKDAGNASPSASAPSSSEPAGETAQETVKISFWHIYTDGPMKTLMDELLADFEKQHPNIKVEQLGINFFDYWTKLSTAMAAGSGPDLALNDTSTVAARAKSGAILSVDEYIQRDGINLDDYFPILVERMKYNGKMYGMPNDTDVRVLYYNKKLFREAGLDPEKPPVTWDELEQYAEKLTKWNSNNLLDVIGFSPAIGNLHLWTLAWTNGGDFWDDEGNPTFNRPENVEALQWEKKIQDKYGVKAMSAFNSQASALGFSPFIAGKAAMVVDVNNLYREIQQRAPDLEFGDADPLQEGARKLVRRLRSGTGEQRRSKARGCGVGTDKIPDQRGSAGQDS